MTKSFTPKQLFLASVWLLVMVGLVMRYSLLGPYSMDRFGTGAHYLFTEEFKNLFLAAMAFIVCCSLPADWLKKYGRMLMLCSLLILALLLGGLLPTLTKHGATRWLDLPLIGSIQPSELVKVTLVIYMADFLMRHKHELGDWKKGFMPVVVILSLMCVLVVLQPDLGTSVLLFAAGVWMMLVAGMRLKHFAVVMVAAIPALIVGIVMEPYRLTRVMSFLQPNENLDSSNFQTNMSKWAITRAGDHFPLGQGFMDGAARQGYLPEASTDFIAAVYIEEFGLIGLAFLLCLYVVLIKSLFDFSLKTKNFFDRCLLTGVAGLIGMQVIINLFVITGMMPNKGMPLPLISSGGTSLLATACLLGLAWRVLKTCPDEESETDNGELVLEGQQNWNGL